MAASWWTTSASSWTTTRLVSLSAVQFSNGFRHDLEATSNLCNERGVYLNLDAISGPAPCS